MGRFGNRNSLSINVQLPPYFSLYILSIDLLNKCQWHLILYILLLVLDSYNIMNHYFLTCSNGFQISLWPQEGLCAQLQNYYILVPIKSP